MQPRLDYVKIEDIERSDYRILENRRGNTVSCPPPSLPEKDQRDKEKEVKIVSGNCPPINHAQDNLHFFTIRKEFML